MSRGCGNAEIVVSPAAPPGSSTCAAAARRFINSIPTSRLSCWQQTALTAASNTVGKRGGRNPAKRLTSPLRRASVAASL